ncbi:MAG TPA: YqcC family protein [Nitrospirota bacterium]|nr:YqcC family protein [Nitrospirota bacterium]
MPPFPGRTSDKAKQVNQKLDQIESEMKRIGYWHQNPPVFEASDYQDAPSFELWLQCIFIPHARAAAREDRYPPISQVGLMAMRQYDYHSVAPEAQGLLRLLNEFDDIIGEKPNGVHN